MKKKIIIGILNEYRKDENRAPITPYYIKLFRKKYHNVLFKV